MAYTEQNYRSKPRWVREQGFGWHGVEHMCHGRTEFEPAFRAYAEAVHSLDRSIGRVLDYLDEQDLANNTLVLYMGDNGFCWGEHGLIEVPAYASVADSHRDQVFNRPEETKGMQIPRRRSHGYRGGERELH